MQTDTNYILAKFRDWQSRQKQRKALIRSGKKPKIIQFEAGNILLVENGKIRLSWEVENAHKITISNGVGEVVAKGEMYVRIPEQAINYKIEVRGGKHKINQSIQIFPEKFNAEPLSNILSKTTKEGFYFPKANVSTPKLEKNKVDSLAFSSLPELSLPPAPTKTELQKLKSELTGSNQLKTVEELQRKLEELKNRDLLESLELIEENKKE